tara:strand:- start:19 stop:150 length:132 start_codon:yes stop_codon:yes gene_type:complete
VTVTDNDHYAFIEMHEDLECENPFDEDLTWWWDYDIDNEPRQD